MEQIETLDTNDFDFVTLVRRSLSNTLSLVLIGEFIPPGDPDGDLFWHRIEVLNFFASHRNDCIISFCPLLRLMPFTKYGQMYTMGVENQRRIVERYFNTVKKQDRTGKDGGMVDFYLEQQKKMKLTNQEMFFTDEIIQSQILDTIEGGHVTTWGVLSNAMLILLNPECQNKLQQEIDRVICHNRLPTFTDRANCPYFMAFEKEMLRYIPVAPLLLPHLCNEDIVFEGYNIRKNTRIASNVWFVNLDEKVWGDPWNFRPERFLDENGEVLPKEHPLSQSILIFGTGARVCPGEMFAKTRMFLYITTMLQKFIFEAPEGTAPANCDPRNADAYDIGRTVRAKPFSVRAVKH